MGRTGFPDGNDPYDSIWHVKLSFLDVTNGDHIASDLNWRGSGSPVLYLSHRDDPSLHGYSLGSTFADFMDRWSLLGCPRRRPLADHAVRPSPVSGVESDSGNARLWRDWFGLSL